MTIAKEVKTELIGKHRQHDKDTGSADVQIAVLSERIRNLTDHVGRHRKDHATRRGLLMLVSQRNRLLRYLQGSDYARYQALIQSLGLRK